MKKLTSLIAGLGLAAGVAMAQELPKNFELPDKFENYRMNAKNFSKTQFEISGETYRMHFYDMDGDFTSDILEIFARDYLNPNSDWLINPWIYIFDRGDGIFEIDEMLIDEKRDGLNGNEKKVSKEIREKLQKHPLRYFMNLKGSSE